VTDTVTNYGTYASFNNPRGVAVDSAGNIYLADTGGGKVAKIDTTGVVSEFGSGFTTPRGLAVDSEGNVYVSYSSQGIVSKIDTDGNVSELISGFDQLSGLAVDSLGNIYFCDTNTVYKRDITISLSLVIANFSDYTLQNFNNPQGIAVDSDGNLYVADTGNNIVGKISASGVVTSVLNRLRSPRGVAVDSSGSFYVADTDNNRVLKIVNLNLFIIGVNFSSYSPGSFSSPTGVAVDSNGNVYVADTGNGIVAKIDTDGNVSGLGFFTDPVKVTVDSVGNVYVIHSNGISKIDGVGNISDLTAEFNSATDIAIGSLDNIYYLGSGGKVYAKNNSYGVGNFNNPTGLTIDSTGNIYVIDSDSSISKITSFPSLQTNFTQYKIDIFNRPEGIAVDSSGNLYVADINNNRIAKITNGVVTTLASYPKPLGIALDSNRNIYVTSYNRNVLSKIANGTNTITDILDQFYTPQGVAVDSAGNVYVADTRNDRIAKITNGITDTLALSLDSTETYDGEYFSGLANKGDYVYYLDNNNAYKISSSGNITPISTDFSNYLPKKFNQPIGIAITSTGIVYVTDTGNNKVAKITNGVVTEIPIQNITPFGIAVDGEDTVYFGDIGGNRIFKITTFGVVTSLSTGERIPRGIVALPTRGDIFFGVNESSSIFAMDITGNITEIFTTTEVFNSDYLALDAAYNMYVSYNGGIGKIDTIFVISTFGTDFNNYTHSEFLNTKGITVDSSGTVYVADSGHKVFAKINTTEVVTRLKEPSSFILNPTALTVDVQFNTYALYGTSENKRIVKISPNGNAINLVLNFNTYRYGLFLRSSGITVDSEGILYVTDTGNGLVAKIDRNGDVSTLTSDFEFPNGITVDSAKNIYFTTPNKVVKALY
jgi:sugar lactone lactonase YvrE